MDINKPRVIERADKQLLHAIKASNSHVPLTLVVTKKDLLYNQEFGASLMAKMANGKPPTDEDWKHATACAVAKIEEREGLIKSKFEHKDNWGQTIRIVLTSSGILFHQRVFTTLLIFGYR